MASFITFVFLVRLQATIEEYLTDCAGTDSINDSHPQRAPRIHHGFKLQLQIDRVLLSFVSSTAHPRSLLQYSLIYPPTD
jgi:hypothetical protein